MILSLQDLFSDKQAVTATGPSTNVIDFGVLGTPNGSGMPLKRDLGQGTKVPLLVQVTEDFIGVTGLTVALQTSDDEAFGSSEILCSESFVAADLVAGARLSLPVVPYGVLKRYLRVFYTVSGAGTAGAVTAGLTMGNDETPPF